MKKIGGFLAMIFGLFLGFAQQNDFFREAKEHYDRKEEALKREYEKWSVKISGFEKIKLDEDYQEIRQKLDSMRNVAYLEALIKTKVARDVALIRNTKPKELVKKAKNYTKEAEYPTGIEGVREEMRQNFYAENINVGEGVLSAEVLFIIDEWGALSDVQVVGAHHGFNKQAEIAMHLLSQSFTPAYLNGKPIKSRFRFPLRMRF